MLQHSGEECGIVLSGSLEVTVGTERRILQAGEAYYFNSSLPHRFRNLGEDICEVVSAATPPSF
jgi:mannose-6-phosphate isomerase-like protein (cupin superfamily)